MFFNVFYLQINVFNIYETNAFSDHASKTCVIPPFIG